MAEAQTLEPTADHDGFTEEERSQFEGMREVPDAPSTPEPTAPAPAEATPAPQNGAPAVQAPAALEAEGDDGEDDDAPASNGAATPAVPGQEAKQAPRRVNYAKFQRLEAKYKDLQSKFSEKEQTTTRLDERLKLLNEALTPRTQQQAPVEEDPEPDAEKDIFGHNAWLKRQLVKQGEALAAIQEGRQTETHETQIARTYEDDARQFVSREPNFVPAYQYLMNSRLSELAMYYFGKDLTEEGVALTAQEIQKIKSTAAGEERQLVAEALQQGQSPAQRVYQLARARGFKPQAAAAPAAPRPAANGAANPTNGAAAPTNGQAAPAPLATNGGAAPAAPSVSDEIARIKAGQEASLSLSGGGGVPSVPFTAQKLADMPQAEFDRLMDTLNPDEVRALMGG